mgnify:CR=1 FL=1
MIPDRTLDFGAYLCLVGKLELSEESEKFDSWAERFFAKSRNFNT